MDPPRKEASVTFFSSINVSDKTEQGSQKLKENADAVPKKIGEGAGGVDKVCPPAVPNLAAMFCE